MRSIAPWRYTILPQSSSTAFVGMPRQYVNVVSPCVVLSEGHQPINWRAPARSPGGSRCQATQLFCPIRATFWEWEIHFFWPLFHLVPFSCHASSKIVTVRLLTSCVLLYLDPRQRSQGWSSMLWTKSDGPNGNYSLQATCWSFSRR